jgi:hypothetical protein
MKRITASLLTSGGRMPTEKEFRWLKMGILFSNSLAVWKF